MDCVLDYSNFVPTLLAFGTSSVLMAPDYKKLMVQQGAISEEA
jgi:hypothetical protein